MAAGENARVRVLFFNDNEVDVEIMRRLLGADAWVELVSVTDRDEFDRNLQQSRFDCLLLDYRIQSVNIFELVHDLCAANGERPIIIVTSIIEERISPALHKFPNVHLIPKEHLRRDTIADKIRDVIRPQQPATPAASAPPAQSPMGKPAKEDGVLLQQTLMQRFYADLIEHMDEGVAVLNREEEIIFVNNALQTLSGRTAVDLLGHHVSLFIPPYLVNYFIAQIKNVMGGHSKITFEIELQRSDQVAVPVLVHAARLSSQHGEIIGAFITLTDLSGIKRQEIQLREANLRLEQQSMLDWVTGVLNHRSVHEVFEIECARAQHEQKAIAIFVVDIDYFKSINNGYGREFGDFVLKRTAELLKEITENRSIIGRLESDEFIVICRNMEVDAARALADRVRKQIAEHIYQNRHISCRLTVSIGLSTLAAGGTYMPSAQFTETAGKALTGAKMKGRNRVVLFHELDDAMRAEPAVQEENKISEVEEQLASLADFTKKSYLESAKALIAALEARDPYTKKHSVNVAHYASLISREMGMTEEQVEMISDAAQLHDIGKIGIPDNILLKKERLTEQEYEIVKRHPLMSVQILRKIKYLESELPIIQCHHERPDGKGYPAGLLQDDIPIGAQIVSVADSFDAMNSLRPYRNSLELRDIVEEFVRNAGSQFNLKIVLAFFRVLMKQRKAPEEIAFLKQNIAILEQRISSAGGTAAGTGNEA